MIFLIFISKKQVKDLCFFQKISIKLYILKFFRITFPNILEPISYQLFQIILVKLIFMINAV